MTDEEIDRLRRDSSRLMSQSNPHAFIDMLVAATERIARLESLVLQLTSSVLSVANHLDELKRRVDAVCDTDRGVCERAAFAVTTATNLLHRVQTIEAQLQRLGTK